MDEVDPLERTVVVTGDFVVDWNLVHPKDYSHTKLAWHRDDKTRMVWQRGGAALLADLIVAIRESIAKLEPVTILEEPVANVPIKVLQTGAPQESVSPSVSPGDAQYHHSYTIWDRFPYELKGNKDGDSPKTAWRVKEFLGFERSSESNAKGNWRNVDGDQEKVDLVVLYDLGLEDPEGAGSKHGEASGTPDSSAAPLSATFRNRRDLWPKAIRDVGTDKPWVILQTCGRLATGDLWKHLRTHFKDRLIVIVTARDLSQQGVHINQGLSWEQSTEDLLRAIEAPKEQTAEEERRGAPREQKILHELTQNAAHVIVLFPMAGAFLYPCPSEDPVWDHTEGVKDKVGQIIRDPEAIHGSWESNHPGYIFGYTSCLTASIARQFMRRNFTDPGVYTGLSTADFKPYDREFPGTNIHEGIMTGLSVMRQLHQEGFWDVDGKGAIRLIHSEVGN